MLGTLVSVSLTRRCRKGVKRQLGEQEIQDSRVFATSTTTHHTPLYGIHGHTAGSVLYRPAGIRPYRLRTHLWRNTASCRHRLPWLQQRQRQPGFGRSSYALAQAGWMCSGRTRRRLRAGGLHRLDLAGLVSRSVVAWRHPVRRWFLSDVASYRRSRILDVCVEAKAAANRAGW